MLDIEKLIADALAKKRTQKCNKCFKCKNATNKYGNWCWWGRVGVLKFKSLNIPKKVLDFANEHWTNASLTKMVGGYKDTLYSFTFDECDMFDEETELKYKVARNIKCVSCEYREGKRCYYQRKCNIKNELAGYTKKQGEVVNKKLSDCCKTCKLCEEGTCYHNGLCNEKNGFKEHRTKFY